MATSFLISNTMRYVVAIGVHLSNNGDKRRNATVGRIYWTNGGTHRLLGGAVVVIMALMSDEMTSLLPSIRSPFVRERHRRKLPTTCYGLLTRSTVNLLQDQIIIAAVGRTIGFAWQSKLCSFGQYSVALNYRNTRHQSRDVRTRDTACVYILTKRILRRSSSMVGYTLERRLLPIMYTHTSSGHVYDVIFHMVVGLQGPNSGAAME